jgi:uncharacterized membrane protein HdeD (DUF308 family)
MSILVYGSDPGSYRSRSLPFIAVGVAMTLFGAAVIALPDVTLTLLTIMLGLLALAAGLLEIALALASRRTTAGHWWWISPLPGVLLIAAAVFALGWPALAATAIVRGFGVLALAWGVADIVLGATARGVFSGWWMRIVRGLLFAAAGVAVFALPEAGLLAAAWVLGLWAVAVGALSVALGLWLRRIPV